MKLTYGRAAEIEKLLEDTHVAPGHLLLERLDRDVLAAVLDEDVPHGHRLVSLIPVDTEEKKPGVLGEGARGVVGEVLQPGEVLGVPCGAARHRDVRPAVAEAGQPWERLGVEAGAVLRAAL